jgi:hypothetical protein
MCCGRQLCRAINFFSSALSRTPCAGSAHGKGDDGAQETEVAAAGGDLEGEAEARAEARQDPLGHHEAVHHPL